MTPTPRLNKRKPAFGRVSDADMHLFRVFVTVVDCGGFSAAQSELGVGRSTISRQISDLETRIGFALCYRGRSGFRLTQHGEQALVQMKRLLTAAEEFASNIAAINDSFIGKIDVAMMDASFTDPRNPMLAAIRAFRQLAPRVKINLAVDSPSEIERGLLEGRYHLGLLPSYRRLTELTYQEIYPETVALFAGPAHPLLAELQADPALPLERIFAHELVYRGYLEGDRLMEIKQQFERGPTVRETEAVAALIEAGAYLGFLPKHSASARLTPILPERFDYSVPICVVTKRGREHSIVTRAFLEELRRD
ncbi:LysR family transcriptional regulator [Phaeovulum sp. W22_SRMD_FR3]|uniref:LysR family transcriptional regulator n=1 Tax=Phaeovulum sp. W22_SRMD_FR3 TaxID=3240274 RepID=UPI003F993E8C